MKARGLSKRTSRAASFGFNYISKADFSQASIIDFCSRTKEEEEEAEKRLDALTNENPAHIQVSDLSDYPKALETSLKTFKKKGINPNNLLPHLSRTAHKTRKEIGQNSFDILQAAEIKEAFIVSGIVKSGPEIARRTPTKFYDEGPQEEFEDFIKEALQKMPNLRFALPLYSDGHIWTNKTTHKGTDVLRIEIDNLMEKIMRICDISGSDPKSVISKIIFQHSFNPERVAEACEMVKEKIGDVPAIPTVLHLGNPKVVHAFSRDGLVYYPPAVRNITERLGKNIVKPTEFKKILQEEANPLIVDMVEKLSKFAPTLSFYVENDPHNLLEVLDTCRDLGFISNVRLDISPETPKNLTQLKFRKELDHERQHPKQPVQSP